MSSFDSLLENDPYIQKKVAEAEARGEARGLEEGRAESVQVLQKAIVTIVGSRFPALTELAQQSVQHVTKLENLNLLLKEMLFVSDEAAIRSILNALIQLGPMIRG